MTRKFYLKSVQNSGKLTPNDCLTILEETEEPFMEWLGTVEGEFNFVGEISAFEYDFRYADYEIYIVYESERDAFAHKLRWHRAGRELAKR